MSALDEVLVLLEINSGGAMHERVNAAIRELAELRAQSVALGRCRDALVDHHQRDVIERGEHVGRKVDDG